MELISSLIRNDADYFQTFSKASFREEFILFHNPWLPLRYDANKAMFLRIKPGNIKECLEDISKFYLINNLVPRIELDPLCQPENLEESLIENNWEKVWEREYSIMVLNSEKFSQYKCSAKFKIEKATSKNISHLLKVREGTIEKDEPKEIYTNSLLFEFMSKRVYYYILYSENQPVSKGCIFKKDNLIRLENVSTIPSEQGKGYGTALVAFLVETALKENNNDVIFLFAKPGSVAERIY
ncbi:GNAT family N-acetyltransferase, partial [Candidatus Dependentiae bacterium]|nr:GNAT family N-acetyltransferase [Candidatus Dependentiae bacterium]